jgi:hypothetical protein
MKERRGIIMKYKLVKFGYGKTASVVAGELSWLQVVEWSKDNKIKGNGWMIGVCNQGDKTATFYGVERLIIG